MSQPQPDPRVVHISRISMGIGAIEEYGNFDLAIRQGVVTVESGKRNLVELLGAEYEHLPPLSEVLKNSAASAEIVKWALMLDGVRAGFHQANPELEQAVSEAVGLTPFSPSPPAPTFR